MQMGTKARLNLPRTNTEVVINNITESFIQHKNKFFKSLKITVPLQAENLLQQSLVNQITKIKNIYISKGKQHVPELELRSLQNHYIFSSIDKASSNFSIICKKLYTLLIMEELGFRNGIPVGNATYKLYNHESEFDIIKRHITQTNSYLVNDKHEATNNKLPKIYGIPKMHKNPIKLRFISGCSKSSTKNISLTIRDILSHLKIHLLNYYNKVEDRTNIKKYWSVDNTVKVHEFINNENLCNTINKKRLFCADFTSLFTNLPHDTVIKSMKYIMTLCFSNALKSNSSDNWYLTKSNKSWSYSSTYKGTCYNFKDILFLINYILDNSFIKFGPYLFKQILGIPQGNNASPFIADLTLTAMELVFTNSLPTYIKDKKIAVFRYMDDILVVHDDSINILNLVSEVYDHNLDLVQTNSSDKTADFLDLSITISNNKLHTKIYNKTDHYTFPIIRYPHSLSVIPKNIIANTLTGECRRFIYGCTDIPDVLIRIDELIARFKDNGFDIKYIHNIVSHFTLKTLWPHKYNVPINYITKRLKS
jgi:hypothetical protein